jgi:hypothetical protein
MKYLSVFKNLIGLVSEWKYKRSERKSKEAILIDSEQQLLDDLGEEEIAAQKKFLDKFEK